MVENIYLVQEIVRKYARKRVSPRCLLKVDLKKAYDMMAWNFIKEMLIKLNFPGRMVKWVEQCITTTSYSLSINGGYYGFFKGRKGLRQGDPLSPLLFVIGMEYLSRLLVGLEQDRLFRFHPRCEHLKISHLAFSDDLVMFSRGDSNSVQALMKCLDAFSKCSGLHANNMKSNILHAGIKAVELEQIRISDLLCGWPFQTISYAGKLELVNSVIQGIECFWLAIFPVQKSVLDHVAKHEDSPLWKKLVDLKNHLIQNCGSSRAAERQIEQWVVDGQISSSVAYEYWRNKGNDVPWFKEVWKCGSIPRHAFTVWLGVKGRLPTNDKLIGDGINRDCVFCNSEMETIDHIFFKCHFSKEIWGQIKAWLGLRREMSSLKAALKWLHKEARGTGIQPTGKKIGLAATVYLIWHFRNRRKFEGKIISPPELIDVIKRYTYRAIFDRFNMFHIL
ncbi:uncharacterized protein LOC131167587 [Malania oleifera]|uniref:uncharacterized protein LOC131167587 n=1 Tax=Malania oleifera TaxID=397392 RepID=UPI0025ADCBD0|nr:uncharacterized protein LOC131167587 [Malania oleifera]